MIRAESSSARISARLDLPAPIGPSTAMYRGLALRTGSPIPRPVCRWEADDELRARVRRPGRHGCPQTQPRLDRAFHATRERLTGRRRDLGGDAGDVAAAVDVDLDREANAVEEARNH